MKKESGKKNDVLMKCIPVESTGAQIETIGMHVKAI